MQPTMYTFILCEPFTAIVFQSDRRRAIVDIGVATPPPASGGIAGSALNEVAAYAARVLRTYNTSYLNKAVLALHKAVCSCF